MARTDTLGNFLTDVADAIRTKKGTSEPITASDFDTEIANIPSGASLSEYITDTISYGTNYVGGWQNMLKKVPETTTLASGVTSCDYMFFAYSTAKKISLPNFDTSGVTTMQNMFKGCSALEEVDLSSFETPVLEDTTYMFGFCASLMKIDIRKMTFSNVHTSSNMLYRVPYNCLIIVKGATEKSWFNSHFSSWNNVKTVEEYEASLI